ncbi:MAG: hypothetical protein IMF11_03650 [Proteobacteria bacterium]|nr:hypothetical protein [Pseudomonadota bacterium]
MPKKSDKQDIEIASYTIPGSIKVYRSPQDDDQLGELREVEIFETEHHVYTTPFRYKNVKIDGWLEVGAAKGVELLADVGSITIVEEKPIISVTVVGSGCSGQNYNIVEWWGPGEKLTDRKTRAPQLIKRQRIDNLKGQHDAWTQSALTQEPPEFESVEEAREYIKNIQKWVYNMTSGYYMPGSLMSGLYENTAYFRIGDTSRLKHTPYKVVIRGGGLDYEDPGTEIVRYPADYTFRLIDIVLKKPLSE